MSTEKEKSKWDKTVEPEKSTYFWNDDPIVYPPSIENNKRDFAVGEMFCGCGGTSKGFEMAGFEIIFGTDIHQPSVETFKNNHKGAVSILSDVSKLTPEHILSEVESRPPDVLVAGVPCQGFSLNNRKRWHKDERNFLFLEFIRFVQKMQPKVVLIENVSGLKSTANGSFVEAIREAIESAGNYSVDFRILNAADFGVPQFRERIFFVGLPKGIVFEWPQKTHGPKSGLPYRTVSDAIADLPVVSSGEKSTYYINKPLSDYQELMRGATDSLTNHEAPNHPKSTIMRISSTKPGEPMYKRYTQRIRLSWSSPSPTQVSGGIRPQFQFGHPEQARGLTVRERCRIQSFPDDYIIYGGKVQGRVQTGNAVPPLLAKSIAQSIQDVLKRI